MRVSLGLREGAYPITADGGEDVEIARVDEVEDAGVDRALAFLKAISDLVLFIIVAVLCRRGSARGRRTNHRLATNRYSLRH